MTRISIVLVAIGLISGCSESSKLYKTAAVSGVITLDGQPLSEARVVFMPSAQEQATRESAPEAAGETDANGRYALKTVFGDVGAAVGRNRVMISTRKTELDPANPDRSKEVAKEKVPGKYFTEQAPLYCDVSATGTKTANFDLTTK